MVKSGYIQFGGDDEFIKRVVKKMKKKKPIFHQEPYGLPYVLQPKGVFRRIRNTCELCGKKLEKSEKDYRNVTICKKCLGGQFK